MKQAYCLVIHICAKAIKKGKGMIGGGRRKVPLRKQTQGFQRYLLFCPELGSGYMVVGT